MVRLKLDNKMSSYSGNDRLGFVAEALWQVDLLPHDIVKQFIISVTIKWRLQ